MLYFYKEMEVFVDFDEIAHDLSLFLKISHTLKLKSNIKYILNMIFHFGQLPLIIVFVLWSVWNIYVAIVRAVPQHSYVLVNWSSQQGLMRWCHFILSLTSIKKQPFFNCYSSQIWSCVFLFTSGTFPASPGSFLKIILH